MSRMTAEIEDARSKQSTGIATGTLAAVSGCERQGRLAAATLCPVLGEDRKGLVGCQNDAIDPTRTSRRRHAVGDVVT